MRQQAIKERLFMSVNILLLQAFSLASLSLSFFFFPFSLFLNLPFSISLTTVCVPIKFLLFAPALASGLRFRNSAV